jgi:hypothetical protein
VDWWDGKRQEAMGKGETAKNLGLLTFGFGGVSRRSLCSEKPSGFF